MWKVEWEHLFLFSINTMNEAQCLVCNQKIKRMAAHSLKRHYEACHSEFHLINGIERNKLISKLKKEFRLKQNKIRSALNGNTSSSICSQIKVSYAVALGLAKKGRPFEDGEFFKEMCQSILPFF